MNNAASAMVPQAITAVKDLFRKAATDPCLKGLLITNFDAVFTLVGGRDPAIVVLANVDNESVEVRFACGTLYEKVLTQGTPRLRYPGTGADLGKAYGVTKPLYAFTVLDDHGGYLGHINELLKLAEHD